MTVFSGFAFLRGRMTASAPRHATTTFIGIGIGAGGIDKVRSAVTFSLDAHCSVRLAENLVLTGTGNTNGTGNAPANRLTGNVGWERRRKTRPRRRRDNPVSGGVKTGHFALRAAAWRAWRSTPRNFI